jgi:hypothetical protein
MSFREIRTLNSQRLTSFGSFEDVNDGVHRKPASRVGVPSIVWHLGLWDKPDQTEADKRRNFLGYVRSLAARIHSLRNAPNQSTFVTDGDFTLPDPDETTLWATVSILRFWWFGYRITLRYEYHSEYISLTTILDLSYDDGSQTAAELKAYFSDMRETTVARAIVRSTNEISQIYDRVGLGRENDSDLSRLREQAKVEKAKLIEENLNHLFGDIINYDGRFAALGELFADFRGLVTGTAVATNAGSALETAKPFRNSRTQAFGRPRMGSMFSNTVGDGWTSDALARLWPIVDSEGILPEHEYTASKVIGRRAIFVTSLGRGLQSSPRDIQWRPVYYFVHCAHDDEWQIGRLVDRINSPGTWRLAAAIDFRKLSEKGNELEALSGNATTANKLLAEIRSATIGGRRPKISIVEDALEIFYREDNEGQRRQISNEWLTIDPERQPLRIADDVVNEITKQRSNLSYMTDIDKNQSRQPRKTIEYRLEKSIYYHRQWLNLAEQLRVTQIDGFQTYTEFVKRRMGGVYGYVDMLSRRLQAVDASIDALVRNYAATKTAASAADVQKQMYASERQAEGVKEIQEIGEVALFSAILPYYIGATLYYIFDMKEHEALKFIWISICWGGSIYGIRAIWVLMKSTEDENEKSRYRVYLTITLSYFICLICLTFWKSIK